MSKTMHTRAPFYVNGRWVWVRWSHNHASLHSAVYNKAVELGADAWDYGQARHDLYGVLGGGGFASEL